MTQNDWFLMESLWHWLGAWSVVIAAIVLWVFLGRVRRSGLRYLGWVLATFAGVLLLPVVAAIGPAVSWQTLFTQAEPPPMAAAAEPVQYEPWFAEQPNVILDAAPLPPPTEAASSPATLPVGGSESVIPESDSAISGGNSSHSIVWWLTAVWGAGCLVGCLRLLICSVGVWRLIAASRAPESAELAADFARVAEELGIRRRVRLLVHPNLTSPVCTGLFRACVIWPAAEGQLDDPQQRRAAILHELAHLKRYDDLACLAAELWRCCCWFFPPVYWTIARMRHEQEFLCDDVAASFSGRPEQYARLLLDLTPVRTRGQLATPFVGAGNISRRIRRIIAGETRPRRPLRYVTIAVLLVSAVFVLAGSGSLRLIGLIERAEAEEPNDRPLPEMTVEELGKKLAEVWPQYDRCRYEATFEQEQNLELFGQPNQGEPKTVQYPGRFRYAGDGRRWRADYDSQSVNFTSGELYPYRWSAGFDGNVHYHQERDGIKLGEDWNHDLGPRNLFMSSWGNSLATSLQESNWKFKQQQVVDGYRCYVLERDHESGSHADLIISPRQSYLPISIEISYKGKFSWSNQLQDLRQTESGLWYPEKAIHHASYRKRESTVTRFEVPEAYADGYFRLEIPYHAQVHDYREGIIYANDPWRLEIAKILKEQHGWPPGDVVPLRQVMSAVAEDREGTIAPALTVDQWLNGDPVTLEQRRGKVTLLLFSSGSLISPAPQWKAALRNLYQIYRPFGLEVIEISTATTDPKRVEQSTTELRIPWPVAVDQPSEDSSRGRTFHAYGLKTYMSMLLVGKQGRIRLTKQDELINVLNELLNIEAVADDPPRIDFNFVEMPREVNQTVDREWKKLVSQAPAEGEIFGTITDAAGHPLPNVQVSAELKFWLAMSIHHQNARHTFRYRQKQFKTVTAEDGTYTLPKLFKGTYDIRAELNGKAIVQTRVSVGPDLEPIESNLVIEQDDGIAGRIVDENGQPLKGAKVVIVARHPTPTTRTNYNPNQQVTEADGLFLISGLDTGAYTIEIDAKGYSSMTLKELPSGRNLGEVRLERAGR